MPATIPRCAWQATSYVVSNVHVPLEWVLGASWRVRPRKHARNAWPSEVVEISLIPPSGARFAYSHAPATHTYTAAGMRGSRGRRRAPNCESASLDSCVSVHSVHSVQVSVFWIPKRVDHGRDKQVHRHEMRSASDARACPCLVPARHEYLTTGLPGLHWRHVRASLLSIISPPLSCNSTRQWAPVCVGCAGCLLEITLVMCSLVRPWAPC